MQEHQRQLAAILFTDIIGYTAMMQEDERRALQIIERYHSALRINVESHHGQILNDYGDGSLCIFSSVSEALNCSIGLQKDLSNTPPVPLRIGLHVGEILVQDKQALGDGVNLASRIQSLGEANSILFSREVFDKIRNQSEFKAVSLGSFEFKNVSDPMEVFALANEGLTVPVRSGMSGKLKNGTAKKSASSKKWMWNIPAIIILLGAFYFIYKSVVKKDNSSSKHSNSIAVLYFNNMSGDSTQEYFSDGITEEITSRLSKVVGLKVKSRTSVLQYKRQPKSAKTIAAELGVKNVLEGSVRKQGNKVVITVQLIDGERDEHIWSDSYDRKLDDIFAVQSEIAQRIAEKFDIDLSETAKKGLKTAPTSNTEAYDLYLRAGNQTFLNTGLGGDQPNTKNAIAFLRQALKLDSLFADAFALLSLNYGYYSFDAQNPGQWLDSAEILAAKAIRLSPEREKGYVAMATIKNWKGHTDESLKWLLKAHEILPFSTGGSIADFYVGKNDYASAYKWIAAVKEYDPDAIENYFSPQATIYYNLGMLDSLNSIVAEARKSRTQLSETDQVELRYDWLTGKKSAYLALVNEMYKNDEREYIVRVAQFYLFQRKWKIADSLYKISSKSDDMDAGLAALQVGKKDLGKKYLFQAIGRRATFLGYDDSWHLYDISRCYAAMQDQRYINFLTKAIEHGWHVYSFFKADPFFDAVRNTPQFIRFSHIIEDKNQQYKADLKKGMEASQE